MIKSGREYAKSHNSPCPLMYSYYKTQYLGKQTDKNNLDF